MNFTRVFRFADSSMITEIQYDPETRAAVVTFANNGAQYLIAPILPVDLAAMVVAPSVGRAYHRLIVDHYTPVRYHDHQQRSARPHLDDQGIQGRDRYRRV